MVPWLLRDVTTTMGSRALDFCEIGCDSVNLIYILVVAKGVVVDCLAECMSRNYECMCSASYEGCGMRDALPEGLASILKRKEPAEQTPIAREGRDVAIDERESTAFLPGVVGQRRTTGYTTSPLGPPLVMTAEGGGCQVAAPFSLFGGGPITPSSTITSSISRLRLPPIRKSRFPSPSHRRQRRFRYRQHGRPR